jgi:ubiquinone/menaquinone biosynthesis C-methylase UbiE
MPRPAPFEDYSRLPKADSTPMVILNAQQAFELWAEVYDDTPNPIVQLSERTILQRISGTSRALRVLDLACGTGRLFPKLLKLGYQCCLGVDSSEAMLRKASSRGEIKNNLIRADAHALPLASGSIDLLILALALSYFKDLERIASELNRVLGPKGRILCTDFHPTACQYGWKRSFKTKTADVEISYFYHSIRNVGIAFSKYFELISRVDRRFGEMEFSSFVRAGKTHVFEEARKIPALVFFEWKKPA